MKEIEIDRKIYRIGVISDTHGLVRTEALHALKGVDLILHAGDIGPPRILEALREISPVVAVRGNMDQGQLGQTLPDTESIRLGAITIRMLHDLNQLPLSQFPDNPRDDGTRLVISGHTHRPRLISENGIMYLNPGSAGPRRFDLPITLARVELDGESISVRHIDLDKMKKEENGRGHGR